MELTISEQNSPQESTESQIKSGYISKKIYNKKNKTLKFTLTNINVSIANAIRRVILMNIPTVVFKTFPHSENLANIITNTTRLNNEVLKQRLACIPIHISDLTMPIGELEVEINFKNNTKSTIFVTTEHFKIRNISSDKYLDNDTVKKIFPPDDITNDFIIFVRLRPPISNEIPGEEINIKSKLTISTSKYSSCYNVCSACAYAFTPDKNKQDDEWQKHLTKVDDSIKKSGEIELYQQNWYNHTAKRFFRKNSFDFIIESIGIFNCIELLQNSCDIINDKLDSIKELAKVNNLKIEKSISTIPNSFDITLENESYTIGKVLEFLIHEHYFKNKKLISYIGFRQNHPHDSFSIIRIAFNENIEGVEDTDMFKIKINQIIEEICLIGKGIFKIIQSEF